MDIPERSGFQALFFQQDQNYVRLITLTSVCMKLSTLLRKSEISRIDRKLFFLKSDMLSGIVGRQRLANLKEIACDQLEISSLSHDVDIVGGSISRLRSKPCALKHTSGRILRCRNAEFGALRLISGRLTHSAFNPRIQKENGVNFRRFPAVLIGSVFV